jgi:Ca2+/Na+ antiporter
MKPDLPQTLFLLNSTVLFTHQIDAAYWHEWNLFHLPGGNQLNLILNLPIIALVLLAFLQVATRSPHQRLCHQFLASLGLLTIAIHSSFLLAGHPEFLQPVSLLLLAATLILSIVQLKNLPLAGKKHQTQNQQS